MFAKKDIRAGAIVALCAELIHNSQLAATSSFIIPHIDIEDYMIVASSDRGYEPYLLASLANDPFVSREDVAMLKSADISQEEDLEKVINFSISYLLKYTVYMRTGMGRTKVRELATIYPKSIDVVCSKTQATCRSLYTPFGTNCSIKKGEEIFFAYGITYWVENLARKLNIYIRVM